ncbi:MAG TPA: TraB/GumN family protein [Acidobacteriaceae bacterium]|nr:TraB/GumN family protein [Acidobacteriaceae bacterium]
MRKQFWVAVLAGCMSVCASAQQGNASSGATPAQAGSAAMGTPAKKIPATPAIWRVKGAHGTVYLFGSVHVMKPDVDWESGKVKTAFDSADTLYLEIANIDDTAAAQPLLLQYGLDPQHPLSEKISKEDLGALDSAVKAIGLPGETMMEPMRPWLVSMTLSILPMVKAGYAPDSGIDMLLLKQTKQASKPVKGFETLEQQIHLVADVPEAEQIAMLHKDLEELDKSTAQMNELVAAWEKGDVEKIGSIDNEELATRYPAVYKRMVVDRNARWVTTLDGVLKDPGTGTVFVAVGAAHLAGPDSVIKLLEKNGWQVERE